MKKYLSLLLTSLLLFCTGCSSSPNVASIEDAPEPTDYTVAADIFDPSQYQQIGSFSSIIDLESLLPTLEELAEQSDNIVYGRVLSTQNYDQSGRGQTLYTFEIQRSYRGNLLPGDTISVVADGGYVRLSRYIAVNGSGHFEDMTQQEIDASMIYSAPAMGALCPKRGISICCFWTNPWPEKNTSLRALILNISFPPVLSVGKTEHCPAMSRRKTIMGKGSGPTLWKRWNDI